MAETATAATGAVVEAHGRKRPYLIVFAALAFVTLLELNIGILGLAHAHQVITLIVLATGKAALVAAYYMHLRYEPRWLILIPLGGFAMVMVLVIALVGPTLT